MLYLIVVLTIGRHIEAVGVRWGGSMLPRLLFGLFLFFTTITTSQAQDTTIRLRPDGGGGYRGYDYDSGTTYKLKPDYSGGYRLHDDNSGTQGAGQGIANAFANGFANGSAIGEAWQDRQIQQKTNELQQKIDVLKRTTEKLKRLGACLDAANAAGHGQDQCTRLFSKSLSSSNGPN